MTIVNHRAGMPVPPAAKHRGVVPGPRILNSHPASAELAPSSIFRPFHDDAGVRLDPDEVVFHLLDARDVFRRDPDRLTFTLVGERAGKPDDPVLDDDVDQPDRRPWLFRQFG